VVRADYYTDCQYIDSFGPVAGLSKLRADGHLVPADWTVRIRDVEQMEVLIQTTAERGAVAIDKTLKKAHWTPGELRWLILDNVAAVVPTVMAEIFSLPEDKVLLKNIWRYGHAWVVDMFVNLATIFDEFPLETGDRLVCAGMGQGEHWGVLLLQR
jgi:3-oxoacyl-[acyl-carrier-protein] synthase III